MDDVAGALEAAKERGMETKSLYTVDPERKVWDFGRVEKQNEIIGHLYSEQADAPCDGHAVMAGGLGGAGKGTVLGHHAGIDRSQYLTVDPDRIKEEDSAGLGLRRFLGSPWAQGQYESILVLGDAYVIETASPGEPRDE